MSMMRLVAVFFDIADDMEVVKNITKGETLQAITSFHFFDYFDFSNLYH